MNIDWNRKYTTIAVYVILTTLVLFLIALAVINADNIQAYMNVFHYIMSPVYIGFSVAYIANPIMKMSEKRIFRFKVNTERRFHLRRGLSIALALIVLAIILTILFLLIIPQVYLSLTDLISNPLCSYCS